MKIALTIAGSDSGGGAGIQADLKTFQQFGVYGTSVVVALTAQNTRGVRAIHHVPAAMVEAQLAALAADLPPAALKTGMLATASIVRLVAATIKACSWSGYVCDPVMVATSGDRLLDAEAIEVLRDQLLPLAAVVTPNLDEAELLAGCEVRDPVQMEQAGAALVERGAQAALVKSGHLTGDLMTDVLVTREGVRRYTHARMQTTSTHGTGCTLSAAITAGIALGRPLEQAVTEALDYLQRAIAAAPGIGGGRGPVNHMVAAPRPGLG